MRHLLAVLLAVFPLVFVGAQAQSSQTARQALIEMFFGQSADHLEKHLPDVTRRTFKKLDAASGKDVLAEFSALAAQARAAGSKFETFDTGSTLLVADNPDSTGEKVELTVERDDLVGDEDQIEIALHVTRKGKEETLPFIPHFTFAMKTQSDTWRLDQISVAVRLPLSDPDFLKGLEDRQRSQNEQMAEWSLQSLARAETAYQSTNGKYACNIAALTNAAKQPGNTSGIFVDPELASGKKNGYIFVISGCDGSHYSIAAEAAVPGSLQRAFCSDEARTIRASDDGKAASCLKTGVAVEREAPSERATGIVAASVAPQSGTISAGAAPKPIPQRVRVSQGVSQALIANRVPPIYPPEARAAKIQGAVVIRILISKTGDISNVELISGHPLLASAALDAVRQWKYRPYLLNGTPVEVETQVTMNFALSGE